MKPKFSILLAVIVVAALGLRVALAAAQLPYHYQADEFQIIERALKVGTGEFNPGLYTWPGSLVIYLNFAAFAVYFVGAKLLGVARDGAAFADLYWRSPGGFYYLGRLLSALFGALAVIATWRWARRFTSRGAATVSAGFVAFTPAALAASAVALPDMAAVALAACALAAAAKYMATGQTRAALWAGALMGLGAACKYHILLYAPALIVAFAFAPPRFGRRARDAGLAVGLAMGAFIIACPFALLDHNRFIADIGMMLARPGMIAAKPNALYTLTTTYPMALGIPFLFVAVFGLAGLALRRDRAALVVALAALPVLALAFLRPLPPRHLLPAIPPLGIAAALWFDLFWQPRAGINRFAGPLLAGAAFAAAFGLDISHITRSFREDTRSEAASYFERAVAADAAVLIESLPPDVESPSLWGNRASLARTLAYYRKAESGSPGRLGYFLKAPAYPYGHRTFDLYLVPAIDDYGAIPRPAFAVRVIPDDPDYFAEQAKPYGTKLARWDTKYREFLQRNAVLVKGISGRGRPGPTIEIWRLR